MHSLSLVNENHAIVPGFRSGNLCARSAPGFVFLSLVLTKPSRGAEIVKDAAEGNRSAEGVYEYVEGVRVPTTK